MEKENFLINNGKTAYRFSCSSVGGIIFAFSSCAARNLAEEYVPAKTSHRPSHIAVWRMEDDDNYDTGFPAVFNCYGWF